MDEPIEGLGNMFMKWTQPFENKDLNVDLDEATVMVSGGIPKVGLSKSKNDLCGVCRWRVKTNSALCVCSVVS